MTPRLATSAALLALLLGACGSINRPIDWGKPRSPTDVPPVLEQAKVDIANGNSERALKKLREARDVKGLQTEVRQELETLLEQAAALRIDELAGAEGNARELAGVVDLGLPNQLAVAAGVEAARLYVDRGKSYKAYKLLRDLEDKYPRHHGKVDAGNILARAGLALADDPFSVLGFFAARTDGIEVLEYLVITYPATRRCDEAYLKLAELYAEDRKWSLARERYEDLRLWHPTSPHATAAEALIPRMRLRSLKSPEYERRELLKARFELETWLRSHTGTELEPAVRLDYADCLERLILNDLSVASFYRRIEQYFGARYHAERALTDARVTGSDRLVAKAERMLQSLQGDDESRTPDAADFSADDSLIQTTIDERELRETQTVPEPRAEP